jgi:hypothetical protein
LQIPLPSQNCQVFFLDDEDLKLVEMRRGDHMKAGFALQLVTVRWLGMFLEDPLDVPGEVLDFVAAQLGIENPGVVKRYTERVKTKSDHQQEIRRRYGIRDFAEAEAELVEWVAARAWTSAGGPKAIYTDALAWLRERKVLLPGVTTLARLVARVRDETTHRLWRVLDRLPEVSPGMRVSDLERSDKGKVRGHPRLAKASVRLAVAVEALFDSDGWGGPGEEPRVSLVSLVWEAIEAVVSRADLRAALHVVSEEAPPLGAEDPDGWRTELTGRYQTVAGFLKMLPEVISFGANAEGAPVLAAMRALPGGRSRVEDLPTSVAACLAAHAMNIGYRPVAKKGVPALERARLSHVYQNYVRPETLAAANAPLVARQADLLLAQAWGGGLVAAVDGMRFVAPVPAAFARPNRKYFGSKRGMTWLNAINDRGMGRGAKIVSGARVASV